MVSQKNSSLKYCIKCAIQLTKKNWIHYLIARSNYICTPCFKKQNQKRYKNNPNYCKNIRNRNRMRRSAVIFSYGNQCAQCKEEDYNKLTIDHKNGGGSAHRREMTTNIVDYLYNNLINRDGYQVLCYNCNCSKNVQYKDKYALKNKKKVIEYYGSYCTVCQEDRIERLTIDHKNNDGAQQRKKYNHHTGSRFYRWLIKKNFPNDLGLQILCYNCNCSKNALSKYDIENRLSA